MDRPMRLLQTNLRETDASLDPARLARQLAEFPANTLLFGMGGIVAYYPTQVEFHYPSPHMPEGTDLFGRMVQEAHARGIRVIGRFDLSKTQKAVYDAHPEWFFRTAKSEPATYNGLYSTCINAGYYRGHAMKILSEALERYEVDGLFFNMFGNPSSDYSGNALGPCHCDSCQRKFREQYGRPVPAQADAEYRRFLAVSAREVAAEIAKLIHTKRPKAGMFTYIQEHVDGIMSESNTSVTRPLPMWPYSASDNVNRARNSEPDKMAVNLCMAFIDYAWRFANVPAWEIKTRLYQNMAHGAGPAYANLATLDQQDRQGLIAAKPVYQWHAKNEDLYVGQESAARVLLLGSRSSAYRGFFRILSELHIPFAVSDNLRWMNDGRQFDLVIAPDGVPEELREWVQKGGRLLAAGTRVPGLDLPAPLTRRSETRGYLRVRDHALFPSLKDTNLLYLDGDFVEFPAEAKSLLTLVPPSMFGPPEKVHVDMVDTDRPGVFLREFGSGRFAYLPWDLGTLYYRQSSPGHAGLVADLVDNLLPTGRQVRTNAHPLVEITVMRQKARNRTLVHLVNLTGHSQTAYFEPLPVRDIRVEVAGEFRSATARVAGRKLPVRREGRYAVFSVPQLGAYEVVVLE